MNRIEELNQSLKDAWSSDQKVKALKIVIQVSFMGFFSLCRTEFGDITCPVSFLGEKKKGFCCFSILFSCCSLKHFFKGFMASDNSWIFSFIVTYWF